ncbi:glycosyltransferase [Escherichia albertii]|uniref:glycosyltransferase n=1 Tax=Escherichia albertii TaxID=208962 RepID=UPI00235F5A36|nr:glycosyltransferase [Escherichia albertii]WDB98343.1 glycosyltransferase [Escherichia albertii]
MKKILIITPRFPFPVIGGDRLRIYKLCEALYKSGKYELTLLSLCETKAELTYDVDERIFNKIYRIYLPKYQSYIQALGGICTSQPLQIFYYRSRKLSKKLEELLPHFDATLSHLIRVGDYLKDNDTCVNFLEMTDSISMNYRRVRDVNEYIGIRGLIYKLEQKRLEKYERAIVEKFALVSFVSDIDVNYLFNNTKHNIRVYANGVDTHALPFMKRRIKKNELIEFVFIGNMLSLQNIDAVKWFIFNVLVKLNVDKAIYRLKIVGKIKDSDRRYFNSISNVSATGAVESISEQVKSGHIGICPIRLGAGLQNKILEYMSLGLPCISSSIGFEGIGAIENQHILVADNYEEYVTSLNNLFDDHFYDFLAYNAREFVHKNYSWDFRLSCFVNDVDNILGV